MVLVVLVWILFVSLVVKSQTQNCVSCNFEFVENILRKRNRKCKMRYNLLIGFIDFIKPGFKDKA